MANNDNDYQVPATLSQGNRPNQIKLTLDEELKTEGSYTLIIPEGMIERADLHGKQRKKTQKTPRYCSPRPKSSTTIPSDSTSPPLASRLPQEKYSP